MSSIPPTITIRPAYADDQLALRRLADLDSALDVPPAPLLVAELDGELAVALSLRDGTAVADPFVGTAHALRLLRLHAGAAGRRQRPHSLRRRRHAPRLARA
jgi:hypothetical protein